MDEQELDAYKFELMPFRICPVDKIIIFFGYPLMGGWLPYIGFKFGYPLMGGWLPYVGFKTFYNERDEPMRTFMIEWFLRGMLFHSNKDEDWYDD